MKMTSDMHVHMTTGVYPQQPRHYSPTSPISPPFPIHPFPLPSPLPPYSSLPFSPLPSLPLPSNPPAAKRLGGLGNAVSSSSGVWGEAPAATSILVYSLTPGSYALEVTKAKQGDCVCS